MLDKTIRVYHAVGSEAMRSPRCACCYQGLRLPSRRPARPRNAAHMLAWGSCVALVSLQNKCRITVDRVAHSPEHVWLKQCAIEVVTCYLSRGLCEARTVVRSVMLRPEVSPQDMPISPQGFAIEVPNSAFRLSAWRGRVWCDRGCASRPRYHALPSCQLEVVAPVVLVLERRSPPARRGTDTPYQAALGTCSCAA